ncbi:MAG: deoxyhypusine synthase [Candidatus Aenigmatarchaeota archaeon]|jgi:deoxyhypusine synthase
MKEVKDITLKKNESVDSIVRKMKESGGFQAPHLSQAIDILEEMIKNKKCVKFLSFTADIISTGARGIIKDMIKNKWFDVIITTCGTLDHDIARSFKKYYQGSFLMNDKELRKREINRLGNVLIPTDSYGIIIEEKMRSWLKEIYSEKKELATYEFCWELGRRLKEDSILYWSWKNKIPIIIPGISDGAVGYQIWQFWQDHKDFNVNIWKDEQYLSDLIWNSEKTGALIIGGGISKHHTIWWNQFKNGLDCCVYITTATELDGSLSGAQTREAISWKKIKENAKNVNLFAEATLVLPFIYSSLLERLNK